MKKVALTSGQEFESGVYAHPIVTVWIDKLRHLNRSQYTESITSDAFQAVYKMVEER
jgi:hypothetical protein